MIADVFYPIFTLMTSILACFIQKKLFGCSASMPSPGHHPALPPDPQLQSFLALQKTDAPIYFLYHPLCKNKSFLHVRVMWDNVTTIAYVNNMDSIKSETCNNIACSIWNFCIENKLWVSAAYVPGKNNIEADQQSRILQDAMKWKIHPLIFHKVFDKVGKPAIVLFTSRINRQVKRYVSWHPEWEAMIVNVISLTWNNNYFYMFLPFSLVGWVLAKVSRDKTETAIVVSDWSTQYWYPQLMQMTSPGPLYFRPSAKNFVLQHKLSENHPLHQNSS